MGRKSEIPGIQVESSEPLRLRGRRRKIYEALVDIDEALGKAYVGAIRVLGDRQNPERMAQAAHSIREIANMISRKVDLPIEVKDDQKRESLARKLPKALDPRGGVPGMRDVYKEWVKKHKWFTSVSHHGTIPGPSEFDEKLRDLEGFLVELVFKPHLLAMNEVDDIVEKGHRNVDILKLRMLLSRSYEIYRYFFDKIDHTWLRTLRDNRFFRQPPHPVPEGESIRFPLWPESQYLARISDRLPDDVMKILLKCGLTDESTPRVFEDFVEAATRMPPDTGARLIKRITRERWIERNPYDLLLSHKLNGFLKRLIESKMYGYSLDLAAVLLDVRIDPQKGNKERFGGPEAEGYIEDHMYEQILKTVAVIPVAELRPFLQLLVRMLCKAISLETGVDELNKKYVKDNSFVWRPAIEESGQNWGFLDVKDVLVSSIRDSLEAYMRHLRAKERSLSRGLEEILEHELDFSILTRFRLHLFRLFPSNFKRKIKEAVVGHFDDVSVWHEYSLLLAQTFARLDRRTRETYLALIQAGPKKKERDKRYVDSWKIHHLAVIKEHLRDAELKQYRELLAGRPEPEQPEFLIKHGVSWTGPASPWTKESLLSESVEQTIGRLISWCPSDDEFSPSPEGLGRTLAEVVEERAEDYSKTASEFLNPNIRPVYVHHFFVGLDKALKRSAKLHWGEVVKLAAAITSRFKTSSLPVFEKANDRLEMDWDDVLGAIVDLLDSGLRAQGLEPDFVLRKDVFDTISHVCCHPEPTPEYEEKYGGNNLDPFTMSRNTVRGKAFHSLFSYMLWCNRKLRQRKKHKRNILVKEVKGVLERHLNVEIEASLTVRSVYGRNLPRLYSFNKKWVTGIISELFPREDRDRRFAAWEAYLSNDVYRGLYEALRPQYRLAIQELNFTPERRLWIDPVKQLAQHMMIGYLYDLDSRRDPLYKEFFRRADGRARGMAVGFVGRAYVTHGKEGRPKASPRKSRLRELWEWRLEESQDVEELEQFGWWVGEDMFENQWLLRRLIETLHKTKGLIEPEFEVLKTLASLAESDPFLSASALYIMVKAIRDRPSYLREGDIRAVLTEIYNAKNQGARRMGDKIKDYLLKLGFHSARDIGGLMG